MIDDERPHRSTTSSRPWRRSGAAGVALAWVLLAACVRAHAGDDGLVERSFAARSGPRGAAMFATLSPEETGFVTENRYVDPRMWGSRYHEFGVGAIGTGVAVGDYDGDGRPDIFAVSKTESCRLFRNLGGWKFEDVTDRAGVRDVEAAAGEWKQGAAFADVDNDGWLDLYVTRFAAPNLLYINQRDGTFKEEAAARGLAVVDACGGAAFCDYDRDGWLDVYLQTNLLDAGAHPNGQRDFLFRNRGDGTFENVTDRAGIGGETQGHSVTWWDADNDGWPDLYIANDFATPDTLYRNNRNGTFTNVLDRIVPHTTFSSMGADIGDIDNDGLIDLFVADMAGTTHEKDQRGMADSRAWSYEDYETPGVTRQYLRNALFLNTGTGSCLEAAFLTGLAATDWTWAPRFEDLDNDGWLDLHVTNGMNREQHNSDLLARIMSAENPLDRSRLMRSARVLTEENLAYRNLGDLRFENVSAAWGLNQNGVSFGSAFGDFDGDGDLDLVYANYQAGATLLRNDSDTGHRLIVELRGTRSNRFGVGATVRIETNKGVQIRQLVLARGYLSGSEPVLHFGLGDSEKIDRLTVTWPSGHTQSFAGLSADRRLTIAESAESTATAPTTDDSARHAVQFADVSESVDFSHPSREAAIDETIDQPFLPIRFNVRGPALAVGDLDGDGIDDIVLGGTMRDPLRRFAGASDSRFAEENAAALATGTSLNDGPLLVFDADGNDTHDLLVTKGGAALPLGAPDYRSRLFLNDGRGGFEPAPAGAFPSLPISAGAAAAADFDRDGLLDAFIGARVLPGLYPLTPRSALLANRGGRFEDVTDTLAPGLREAGLVSAALWTDVDDDGWMDLLIALEWGGVRYWRNAAGRGFEDRSEQAGFAAAGSGWWTSLAAADFNGDGRLDYVAGNLGLNTQYHASAERPALLFYGDFGNGEMPHLIEAHYEGDRIVPWRTRKKLGAKISAILKRFPKNDAYARATLGEVIGEDRLADAQRFAATEFRSGVFLSQPDGKFLFEPLPRIAQIAPLQGVVAGDFDGDGFADIYAVQNSYAPVHVAGHFDGGLSQLLSGDGRGHFTPVVPRESGLVVRRDAKALAVLDLDSDGWPDFVVSRNNDTTMAFRNKGASGRHSVRVALRGPAGNRTAVGAQLAMTFADGSMQVSEISAGSGYYSQSAAACFFGHREGNPPRELRVRWPSGARTVHEVRLGAASMTVADPAK